MIRTMGMEHLRHLESRENDPETSHEQDSLKIDQMLAKINDLTAQLKRQ